MILKERCLEIRAVKGCGCRENKTSRKKRWVVKKSLRKKINSVKKSVVNIKM